MSRPRPIVEPRLRPGRPTGVSRILVSLLLACGVLTLAQAPCSACSCAQRTPEQVYADAATVIDGEVLSVSSKDQQQIVYEVQVYRVFKGQRVAERIEMASAADSAACGLETQVCERRIWYLDQGYRANLCSNLSAPKLPDSIPDATNLPKGTPPVTLPAEAAPTESLVPARWGLGLIGLGLAVTGLVWLRARRRPVS